MSDQSPKPAAPGTPPTPAQLQQAQQHAAVMAALRGAAPRLYANTIHLAQTSSDISLILMNNAVVTGVLSLSYVSAKSLRNELDKAITQFEKAVGQKIMTVEEINEKLQKVMEGTNATRIT